MVMLIDMLIKLKMSVSITELLDGRLCGPSGLSGPIGVGGDVRVLYSGELLVEEAIPDEESEGIFALTAPT